jgi:hypothetical protein
MTGEPVPAIMIKAVMFLLEKIVSASAAGATASMQQEAR